MLDALILFVVIVQSLFNLWVATVLHNMVQGLYPHRTNPSLTRHKE